MPRIDIDFSFKRHPLTGDIATKKGSAALKQSIRNIVLTDYYERGFNIEVATNLSGSMFELGGVLMMTQIRDNITNALKNFEPDCAVLDVEVIDNDDNSVDVTIYYNEFNNPDVQDISIGLSRLR
jgi:phage baseplate assembly protein W